MNKDIKILDEIINLKELNEIKKRKFFWLYLFTNENIKAYYSYINFNNKDVLCVTSSGDHALNALLVGAKNVTSFDINPLAKYYSELKIAAIKSLTLEEFILFFYNKKISSYKYFMNKETYKIIRNNLENEYKEFWDYFFNKYTKKDFFKSYLFSDDYLNLKGLIEVNSYLDENNYYKLRDILKNKSVTYYDLNLKDLPTINSKFDIVLLSNISAFLNYIYDKEFFVNLKKSIDSISKEDTKIVVNYFYDNILFDKILGENYDKKYVSKYFKEQDFEYKSFESSEKIHLKVFKLLNPSYDQVLITKNKK